MERELNTRIRKLCGVAKGVNKRIDESTLYWFGHIERMNTDRIGKRVMGRVCE